MGLRKPPRVFTEYGVAMVLSRLNPERVAEVCVQIIQAFVILKKAMMQGNLLNHCRCHTSDMLRQYPFFLPCFKIRSFYSLVL